MPKYTVEQTKKIAAARKYRMVYTVCRCRVCTCTVKTGPLTRREIYYRLHQYQNLGVVPKVVYTDKYVIYEGKPCQVVQIEYSVPQSFE